MILPQHIAIIMDGNGRWADKNGLPRVQGHERGAEVVRTIVDRCAEIGIPFLTLYAFSSENWGRPKAEVDALMTLLVGFLEAELPRMQANDIRLNTIGEIDTLPDYAKRTLLSCLEKTASNRTMTLTLALSYGGRNELVRAVQTMADEVRQGTLDVADITEGVLAQKLDTKGLPDPDLLIRTSGELRLSNFLLWQSAYTEFYFTDTLWPDFDLSELQNALNDFAGRDRRFGLRPE